MRKVVSLVMFLFAANLCMAGNVKVMKTKYVGADYDLMSGPYMTVKVGWREHDYFQVVEVGQDHVCR